MRWFAAALALLVAILELALFALAEQRSATLFAVIEPGARASWLRWLWAGAYAAPWLVAAGLLAAGAVRRGIVVLVTAAVLLLATGSTGVVETLAPTALVGPGPSATVAVDSLEGAATTYGGVLLWLLALGAAIAAVLAHPDDGWREHAPGPTGVYVTLAILAWMPAAFQTTAFAPPGAPRAFLQTDASSLGGAASAASVATAVAVALVLIVACRLRPALAAAAVLTYAGPALFAELGSILQVRSEEFVIFTPAGVLGLVGIVGLLFLGVRWLTSTPEHQPAR